MFSVRSLLEHVYWYAIGEIQQVNEIQAFAAELHRLATALEKERQYKPNTKSLGFPQ